VVTLTVKTNRIRLATIRRQTYTQLLGQAKSLARSAKSGAPRRSSGGAERRKYRGVGKHGLGREKVQEWAARVSPGKLLVKTLHFGSF